VGRDARVAETGSRASRGAAVAAETRARRRAHKADGLKERMSRGVLRGERVPRGTGTKPDKKKRENGFPREKRSLGQKVDTSYQRTSRAPENKK